MVRWQKTHKLVTTQQPCCHLHTSLALPANAIPPHLSTLPQQAVYKTYIDVVHVQKDEASNLFSMFAAEESQTQAIATAAAAGEVASQDGGRPALADAPDTQGASHLLHTSNMTREEMAAKRAEFQVG